MMSPNSIPDLLTIRQAAEYLNVAVVTIKHHVYKTGNLKADYRIGRQLLFKRSTLDDFNRNRHPGGRPSRSQKVVPPR